jgi:hypothetical protein
MAARLALAYPKTNKGWSALVLPLGEDVAGAHRHPPRIDPITALRSE